MKTLVTGATGFIGSRLAEKLLGKGTDVRCIAKDIMNAAVLRDLGAEIIIADLNNGISWDRLLEGVDRVYHLAGATRARRASEYYVENYHATKRIAEECARHAASIRRFVYVGSQTAAGPSPDGTPLSEDSPCSPVSHYGRSKLMGERAVLGLADRLNVTVVRPTAVYGPRDRDFCDLFRLARRRIRPLIGLGRKIMNLIHVDDLVDGILVAGTHPRAAGETYFIGSGEAYSTETIGAAIAGALGLRTFPVRIPHAAVYAVGAVAQAAGALLGKKIFFNIGKARESTQTAWVCSVEKARRQLGFQATTTLTDGMRSTCRWYLEQGWLC